MDHPVVRFLSFIVLGILCTLELRSQTIDWARVHELTARGLDRLYSLEVDDAIQEFDSVSRMAPTDPRGPFFESMVHFYLFGLHQNEKELLTFLDHSERVIDICERLLDQNNHDVTTKFYLGGIYGYRGLAYQASGSILKAVRDGRKGFLLLEEAVSEDPALYDAQMGFGLFRYLLAKIPRSMSWILSLLGFDGDLEGGLHSLRLAAEKGVYTRVEAKLYLAQFLFTEGRRDTALQYLNELRKEYPENTLFLILYASWQQRLNNSDEALTAALAAVDLNSRKKIRYGEEFAYSTLGNIYFIKNNFADAYINYRQYMEKIRDSERTPNWTFLRAGLACEIAGDRAVAVEFYRRMKQGDDKNHPGDRYNYRRGQELLQRPLTEAEILIVKAGNELSQKKYERSIQLYQDAFGKASSDVDSQLEALYGILQAQYEMDKFAEAQLTSSRLFSLKPVHETWIIPHAYFKLGQAFAKMGKPANALASFERVRNYDGYDFQERLEDRVNEAAKKLEEAK